MQFWKVLKLTIIQSLKQGLDATIDGNDNTITKDQAEDMVSQLKFDYKHLGVDEDAFNFNRLDQFIRLVRNTKK